MAKTRIMTTDRNAKIWLDGKLFMDFSHYKVPEIRRGMVDEAVAEYVANGDGYGNPIQLAEKHDYSGE